MWLNIHRALHVPLFISHCHPTIVEQSLYAVLKGHNVLSHALTKDVDLMLQLCPLLA
jgi:hypothetical protein